MIKTYRIIPLVFILFLFGFTLITASPVIAQTVDQLIESIEKLDANDRARVLEYKYSPPHRPSDATPAAEADAPWSGYTCTIDATRLPIMMSSMNGAPMKCKECREFAGNGNPCTVRDGTGKVVKDTGQTWIARTRAYSPTPAPSDSTQAAAADGPWDKSMGMRHPARPCMKNGREKGPRFGCGRDMRSPEQIASDPYDTNNPASQAARAREAAGIKECVRKGGEGRLVFQRRCARATASRQDQAAEADGQWNPSMGMRHPDRPCMKVKSCGPDTRSPEEIASDPYDTPTGRAATKEKNQLCAKKRDEWESTMKARASAAHEAKVPGGGWGSIGYGCWSGCPANAVSRANLIFKECMGIKGGYDLSTYN
jgi:hypothetical protein